MFHLAASIAVTGSLFLTSFAFGISRELNKTWQGWQWELRVMGSATLVLYCFQDTPSPQIVRGLQLPFFGTYKPSSHWENGGYHSPYSSLVSG
ncbi:predicted protein [Lichtheimia corymbifera JMRC:FSU:9682]|uniref:Uncharacterized protein n=1 Tax=Lichtheimia corymbifera JMRC:FSU:9682 TaxID=1263082 RepID=A0A068SF80_9FUNG|nr:predicted protein [Lichtheimia corymbifera JMRC:FSU:9682]